VVTQLWDQRVEIGELFGKLHQERPNEALKIITNLAACAKIEEELYDLPIPSASGT
jgi:hypothetical protein